MFKVMFEHTMFDPSFENTMCHPSFENHCLSQVLKSLFLVVLKMWFRLVLKILCLRLVLKLWFRLVFRICSYCWFDSYL